MIKLNIQDEFSPLEAVILGRARGTGPAPLLEEAYDPKSAQHIKAGTYPAEDDMVTEMDAVAEVFKKYGLTVYRPEIIPDYNQIFARDIGFTIEDYFFKANILPERDKEIEAIQNIIDQMDPSKVITFPEEAHVEGGDVMPHNDYIFVGTYRGADYSDFITARTNHHAVKFLQKTFPNKIVKSFDLRKSNTIAEDNALHLDCCFQPIGKGKCIIHKEGFLVEEEYNWLVDYFGKENCFHIDKKEMYNMFSNIFSISEDVVISERNFTRLNQWLEQQGFTVEKVPYFEISKQEGLLRCSTLPLRRSI